MSKAPRVAGYKEISFWQEDGIGVITILSDDSGNVTPNFFEEILKAISVGIVDEKVKAIAITGSNENFLSGMRKHESMTISDYLEMTSALATFLGTMNKPLFALVNGKCSDMGVEVALLCDTILATEKVEFNISEHYLPTMGLSRTIQRFSHFRKGRPVEGMNCDVILPEETFLDESSKYILSHTNTYLVMMRQDKLRDFNNIINFEQKMFLTKNSSANGLHNSAVEN